MLFAFQLFDDNARLDGFFIDMSKNFRARLWRAIDLSN